MPEFYSTGEIVYLGRELGRGGEGTVYEVADQSELVAKIYHEPVDAEKSEKLQQMVALQNAKLLKLAAWVTDVLRDKPAGRIVGFLMPKINFGTAIHELYNPQSRRQHFPAADWRFLIHAAANLARAFSVIHAHGHAVGDVNHGNVVIGRDATVRLIDCDSYHLNAPDKSYLCEVGVSTHTPPELQNHSLRSLPRTANHDAFGLAVLIFQLLFMGRHPFSGNFQGDGENTLESSIQNQRFAYGDGAAGRQMKPPPGTLPLSAVSFKVARLFESTFLKIEDRPTAREWIAALEELEQNLHQCAINSGHYYLETLKKCPWCRLEGQTGVLFFPAKFTGNFEADDGEFDLYTLGNLIDAIKAPNLAQNLPSASTQNLLAPAKALPPSSATTDALANFKVNLAVCLLGIAVLVFVVSLSFGFGAIFWMGFAGFWVISEIAKSILKIPLEDTQLAVDAAHQNWQNFTEDWRKTALAKPFESARSGLKAKVKEYRELTTQTADKDDEILPRRLQLQAELRGGLTGLQQISLQLTKKHQDLSLQSDKLAGNLSQAESDLKRVSDLKKQAVAWMICIAAISFTVGVSVRQLNHVSTGRTTHIEPQDSPVRVSYDPSTSKIVGIVGRTNVADETAPKFDSQKYNPANWGKAGEFYQSGENFFSTGSYQEAIKAYQEAARANPKISQIYNKMGEAYFQLAQYGKAVETYQKALKIDANDSDVWHKLGMADNKLNRIEDAILAFKKAIENNLRAELSYYELGLCYAKVGNQTLAQKQYDLLDKIHSPLAEKLWGEIKNSETPPPASAIAAKPSVNNYKD